jgi:hypothetical protein
MAEAALKSDLYELACTPSADWSSRCDRYAEALRSLENRDLDTAQELAEKLAADFPTAAAIALAGRVAEAQQAGATSDTSIWCLPG